MASLIPQRLAPPKSTQNPYPGATRAGRAHSILFTTLVGLLLTTALLHHLSGSAIFRSAYLAITLVLFAETLYFGLVVRQMSVGNKLGSAVRTYTGSKAVVCSLFYVAVAGLLVVITFAWS